jgi:hypothetical protein
MEKSSTNTRINTRTQTIDDAAGINSHKMVMTRSAIINNQQCTQPDAEMMMVGPGVYTTGTCRTHKQPTSSTHEQLTGSRLTVKPTMLVTVRAFLMLFISMRIYIHLAYTSSQQILATITEVHAIETMTETDREVAKCVPHTLVTNSKTKKQATGTSPWWMASYPTTGTGTADSDNMSITVIYPSYPQIPLPCFPADIVWQSRGIHDDTLSHSSPTDRGLIFVKLLKVASSTASGIHLRIADREAQRVRQRVSTLGGLTSSSNNANNGTISINITNLDICQNNFHHGLVSKIVQPEAWTRAWTSPSIDADMDHVHHPQHPQQDSHPHRRQPVVEPWRQRRAAQLRVWTMVREPTVRAISYYVFLRMVQYEREPTVKEIIAFLKGQELDTVVSPYSHYRTWMSTGDANVTPSSLKEWNDRGPEFLRQIMTDFDFIGVTERFDESIIVLSILWQIPLGDLLYLTPAKARGSWTPVLRRSEQHCFLVSEPPLSILQLPKIQRYLRSSKWRTRVYWDQRIYHSAVASLDATIASIGVDRVQKRLAAFQAAQAVAAQACPPELYQPCFPNGTMVREGMNQTSGNCYELDMGCGHVCLDHVAEHLGLNEYHEYY